MRASMAALGWLLPFVLLVSAIVAVPLRIFAPEGLPRYRALSAELDDVAFQNRALGHELEDLEREVDALRTDPSALERVARDELGMVRPGELVFQF